MPRALPQSSRFLYVAGTAIFTLGSVFDANRPEIHEDILEHFKYGSIGAEERAGIPYSIWRVLPRIFPQHLPEKPGDGYERFGSSSSLENSIRSESASGSVKSSFLGLNCAVCHTGTVRDTQGGPRQIVLGMPAHQIDLQSYQRFLFKTIADPQFTHENVWAAIRADNPGVSWLEALIYRWFVIPRTKDVAARLSAESAWFDARPPQGPGRVDTFNPYKVMFGFEMKADKAVGTVDLPSLWNQKIRDGMWLHWDGNNNLITERNKSAAIGAGCSESSLDLPSMKRVEDWIWALSPPMFPAAHIDRTFALAGAAVFKFHCANCHESGGGRVGQVTPIAELRTDPERVNCFSPALAAKMNTLGAGRPWKFSHFRKTDGYAAMPLDGVWLRAPYLHNGSVPTIRDLLEKPENRPSVFWRGYDVYDYKSLGFIWSGTEAETAGFRYDTSVRGNSNAGHAYGTELKAKDKEALLEYLKTL